MEEAGSKLALLLLDIRSQVKIFHWKATQYGEHKALDWLDSKLIFLNDKWVETFQGKYGQIQLQPLVALTLRDYAPGIGSVYLKAVALRIQKTQSAYFSGTGDGDLSNVLDEIVGSLNQTCYLLSLK